MQRHGFSTGSRPSYLSGFTNAAYAPSLASNGKTTCQTKKSSREPACPAILLQVQLRRAGHVTRMEDVYMPKAVFFSELQGGKRDQGAPRKRYKDQLEEAACTSVTQPSVMAAGGWYSSVRKVSRKFEEEIHEAVKERRRRQKKTSCIAIILGPSLRLSKVQLGLRIKNGTIQPPRACKNRPSAFPKSSSARSQPSSSV